MSRLAHHRFTAFLDRFEERLEVDCDRVKRQLVTQVDQQFGLLRTKICELRSRFGSGRAHCDASPTAHLDDPTVETVSLHDWLQKRGAATEEESYNAPFTSSGHKRKSISHTRSTNKRQKTIGSSTTTGTHKFECKYPRCGKTFPQDWKLLEHEHTHLGVKPFICILPNCDFSSTKKDNAIRHIREKHFELQRKEKSQQRIIDKRDPNQYLQVDNDLLAR